jgi:hypothetical protein
MRLDQGLLPACSCPGRPGQLGGAPIRGGEGVQPVRASQEMGWGAQMLFLGDARHHSPAAALQPVKAGRIRLADNKIGCDTACAGF